MHISFHLMEIHMLKKLALIAVLVQFAAVPAFAQATRAEVKAEAASANKAGATKTGEGSASPTGKSIAARADVKKDAAMAEKTGANKTGEGSASPTGKSTKARADVKKEAAAAEKAGTNKTGEGTK